MKLSELKQKKSLLLMGGMLALVVLAGLVFRLAPQDDGDSNQEGDAVLTTEEQLTKTYEDELAAAETDKDKASALLALAGQQSVDGNTSRSIELIDQAIATGELDGLTEVNSGINAATFEAADGEFDAAIARLNQLKEHVFFDDKKVSKPYLERLNAMIASYEKGEVYTSDQCGESEC